MKHTVILLVLATAYTPAWAVEQLPYPAREAVRRQSSNVEKVEKQLEVLKAQSGWQAYPYEVKPGLGVSGLLDSIEADLDKSNAPKDHPTVADMYARVAVVRGALPELEQTLTSKHAKWNELADVKNYPHLDQDLEKLEAFWHKYKSAGDHAGQAKADTPRQRGDMPMYAQPMQGIDEFATAANDYPDDADYFNGVMKRYVVLMKVNKGVEATLMAKAKAAQKYMVEFTKVRDQAVATFPANITHNLDVARKMAQKASDQRKPGFFTGGVPQAMQAATVVLGAYRTVKGAEDAELKTLEQDYATTKAAIETTELALAETILQEARCSKNRYSGNDKAKLIALVKQRHADAFPAEAIIDIRCPQEAWERHTAWKANAVEWYKVDYSEIVFLVNVKLNDRVAQSFPAYIHKNHLKNDTITCTPKASSYAHRKFLLANIDK